MDKNIDGTYFSYYKNCFDKLFDNFLAKESFFLQLLFLGEVKYAEGNIAEANRNIFDKIQQNINNVNFTYRQGDFLSNVDDLKDVDLISMSNVPSYLSGDREVSFLESLSQSLSPKGHIVSRYYLRIPNAIKSAFENVNKKYQEVIDADKIQMYKIEVLKKRKS